MIQRAIRAVCLVILAGPALAFDNPLSPGSIALMDARTADARAVALRVLLDEKLSGPLALYDTRQVIEAGRVTLSCDGLQSRDEAMEQSVKAAFDFERVVDNDKFVLLDNAIRDTFERNPIKWCRDAAKRYSKLVRKVRP